MSENSSSFSLLDERIQKFIWAEGWEALRDVQEQAIPLIVDGQRDVVIAAATASGKTEAAFFPALSAILREQEAGLIVYVSPLKALINDQFGRLDRLCANLDLPVWPWHGDIASSRKQKFAADPRGVLLITPESLEATLCNRGTQVSALFARTQFFIIDELHAFIGSERGKQLQSLLHRIEVVLGRSVVRVGLSATLGDMKLATEFLRPGRGPQVQIVDSKSDPTELRVRISGYEEPLALDDEGDSGADEAERQSPAHIAASLFKSLRGTNNLVFPNSRREVERYTFLLNRLCTDAGVGNEFWPHHGSLSAELRRETEGALKNPQAPATAICTNTLELGIDIGAVRSVAQIGPPPSVSSLRQRMGRSGRRKGEPAVLRGYVVEDAVGPDSTLNTLVREQLLESIACVELLTEGWCEPPRSGALHGSTLVQQVLALIAERGGAQIGTLFSILCGEGTPFAGIQKADFIELIQELGRRELLAQDSSGLLLHGRVGEKFVNHFAFYAAFASEEEFRVVAAGKTLGSLPITNILMVHQYILFGGRTWRVDSVDEARRELVVSPAPGGRAPPFNKGQGRVHSEVRRRMRQLLTRTDVPKFLDPLAARLLDQGRSEFRRLGLDGLLTVQTSTGLLLLTWLGDAANDAIVCLLERAGVTSENEGIGVGIISGAATESEVLDPLIDAASEPPPPPEHLLAKAKNLQREKWDWALPQSLLQRSFASQLLDVDQALAWVRSATGADSDQAGK